MHQHSRLKTYVREAASLTHLGVIVIREVLHLRPLCGAASHLACQTMVPILHATTPVAESVLVLVFLEEPKRERTPSMVASGKA